MITQIHYKKNELFEVEFYQDKECTQYIKKITGKDIYIELQNGDITPLMKLERVASDCKIYTPMQKISIYSSNFNTFQTLNDITPNLSKYIPEDNAVLFLSDEDSNNYKISNYEKSFIMQNNNIPILYTGLVLTCMPPIHCTYKKATIFLHHGTKSELQKAIEVEKELKEKYGVQEVNLFALHWFGGQKGIKKYLPLLASDIKRKKLAHYNSRHPGFGNVPSYNMTEEGYARIDAEALLHNNNCHFNKIITTNSTGISPVQDKERLQVIDAKEIFEEYLNGNNLIQTL